MDKIFVKNLRCDCIIGILPEERVKTQPLLVSMELGLDLEKAAVSGELSRTSDYGRLSVRVKEYIIARKALLLEELAYELCNLIETEFKPCYVKIRLDKPQALADAEGCGIEISKGVEN